jgi:cytochrome P450
MTTSAQDALLSLPAQFWNPETEPYFDDVRGTWHVFSHADVRRVLSDADAFSRKHGEPDEHPTFAAMWSADDPRHSDLRAIVSDPFRQSVLRGLEASIQQIVDELIDAIIATGAGQFDAVAALGRPLPNRVICHIMGVDIDEDVFFAWLDEVASRKTLDTKPRQPEMSIYFGKLLEERRESPQGGLVDELITHQKNGYTVAGEPLSDRDMIAYLFGLVAAGSDTTATGLVNVLLFLSAYGFLGEVRDDRTLVRSAIDEALRWCPPFPAVISPAKSDLSFGSRKVRAGQYVTAWISAANRDATHFPDPNVFDIRRRPNAHFSFGLGGHHCLGAPLARLELQIALNTALDRLPGLRWDADLPFGRTLGIVNRVREAHFTFDHAD